MERCRLVQSVGQTIPTHTWTPLYFPNAADEVDKTDAALHSITTNSDRIYAPVGYYDLFFQVTMPGNATNHKVQIELGQWRSTTSLLTWFRNNNGNDQSYAAQKRCYTLGTDAQITQANDHFAVRIYHELGSNIILLSGLSILSLLRVN